MSNMVKCPHCGFEFSDELTCLRCGHKWKPRSDERPTVCANPDCKSPYWDKPRKADLLKNKKVKR